MLEQVVENINNKISDASDYLSEHSAKRTKEHNELMAKIDVAINKLKQTSDDLRIANKLIRG